MFHAQFGLNFGTGDQKSPLIRNIFRIVTEDLKKYEKEFYIRLSLQSYPSVPAFAPFKDWAASNPTTSLRWYDAYNKTKHDREGNLNVGTLNNAVQAVGAAAVVQTFKEMAKWPLGIG